ncbi:MAG: hypothetical protein WBG01_07870 [Bacteroidota bacterium]
MITDPKQVSAFDAASRAKDDLSLAQKYAILEGLYQEARRMGYFTQKDLLEGIDDDIRLAALLNGNVSVPPRKDR